MFRRHSRKPEDTARPPSPGEVFRGLREQVLDLDPATVGLAATGPDDRVWGCLMETGYPNATATLVCLRDGTTSLYTSSGFGIIGGGTHQAVVQANDALLTTLTAHLDLLAEREDRSLPAVGRTIIRALTYQGLRAYEAAEDELGNGRDALSPVFYAAHGVIAELRLIDEKRR